MCLRDYFFLIPPGHLVSLLFLFLCLLVSLFPLCYELMGGWGLSVFLGHLVSLVFLFLCLLVPLAFFSFWGGGGSWGLVVSRLKLETGGFKPCSFLIDIFFLFPWSFCSLPLVALVFLIICSFVLLFLVSFL